MDIKNADDYSVYDHLKANDIIGSLTPLLDSGAYKLRKADGKFVIKQIQASTSTPWIHIRHVYDFDCHLWHQIVFDVVSSKLPKRFVPRKCQQCWKVVVKPRTLQQLFNLHELQKQLDRPSKCGIEVREAVHGLYGGYFYNKSLEEGLLCYDIVKNALLQNEVLSPLVDEVDENGRTTRVILKRACTEYEHAVGDSDKWEITPEQNAIEDLIERYIVAERYDLAQPEHLVWNIKKRWIEWAWQNGDATYSRYTAGNPLYPNYVTYHQMDIEPKGAAQ